MKLTASDTALLLGGAFLAVMLLSNRRPRASFATPGPRRRRPRPAPDLGGPAPDLSAEPEPEPDLEPDAANRDPGIAIGDQMVVMSWDRWVAQAPQAIAASLKESDDPEQIAVNSFRRLYPNIPWPPAEGTPLWEQWQRLVAAVGRTLERPFRSHLHVVS